MKVLEEMRVAYATRDYRRLLTLAAKETSVRTEAERLELLHYRATALCAAKDRFPELAAQGRNMAEQALQLMTTHRHALIVPAAVAAGTMSAALGDLAAAARHARLGFDAGLALGHPETYATAYNGIAIAATTGHIDQAHEMYAFLRNWFDTRNQSDRPVPWVRSLTAAFRLADAAALFGERQQATVLTQEADRICCAIFPLPDGGAMDIIAVGVEVMFLSHLVRRLGQHGPHWHLLPRLRRLQSLVGRLPHLEPLVAFDLWLNLARLALWAQHSAAAPFGRAAHRAHMEKGVTDPEQSADLGSLLAALPHLVPRRQSGELAGLLNPESWSHFHRETDALAAAAAPAALITLLN